jgi:hypothetical protein
MSRSTCSVHLQQRSACRGVLTLLASLLTVFGCGAFDGDADTTQAPLAQLEQAISCSPPCGTTLATIDGVNAYSNSPNQQTIVSCGGAGTNLYQSPEFVRRYWSATHGVRLPTVRAAADLCTTRGAWSIRDKSYAPRHGNLVVFPISPTSPAGHVAVVDNLSGGGSTIDIVEQNGVCSGRRAVPRASVQCFLVVP